MKKLFFPILFLVAYLACAPFVFSHFWKEVFPPDTPDKPTIEEPWEEETPAIEVTPIATLPPSTDGTETTAPASENETGAPTDKATDKPTGPPAVTEAPTQRPGREPAAEKGSFVTVDASYLDDALIIGDSRIESLKNYGNIKNATFYATVGLSVFNIDSRSASVNGRGTMSFQQLLDKKDPFKKVYICLGFNEIGYPHGSIIKKYGDLMNRLKAAYPDAKLFLMANLHLTAHQSEIDPYATNELIVSLNNRIADLADGVNTFYIDVNPLFCDEAGNLRTEVTGDGTHPKAKYYPEWTAWILSRGVQ